MINGKIYLIALTFHLLSQLNTVLCKIKESLYTIIRYKSLSAFIDIWYSFLYITKEVSTLKLIHKNILSLIWIRMKYLKQNNIVQIGNSWLKKNLSKSKQLHTVAWTWRCKGINGIFFITKNPWSIIKHLFKLECQCICIFPLSFNRSWCCEPYVHIYK